MRQPVPSVNRLRVHTVDALRGFAALSVCWFHLTNGNARFLSDGYLKLSGAYGWTGVQIFFVISGFIIPLSLWQSGYRLKNYARFIAKRIVRLDPPYLLSILLVLALTYLSVLLPGFHGKLPTYSLPQMLAHIGFLNAFFGYEWVNIVYWSLAIEFQYYLLIALLFPLLVHPQSWIKLSTCLLLLLTGLWIPPEQFVFAWLPLFLLGIFTFYHKVGLLDKKLTGAALIILTSYIYWKIAGAVALVGLLTSGVILWVEIKSKLLKFSGDISYSLYLVHLPIGVRIINLSAPYAGSLPIKIISLAGALGLSIGVAYLFYFFIELPSREWSSSISYDAT